MNLAAIQEELRRQNLDGWLFFDHHLRDPLAYRVLGLTHLHHVTRRWYFLIPANGEPRRLVHRIEAFKLDSLPGEKAVYSSWKEQVDGLGRLLNGSRRIAMQYSPQCAIPYVSMVDAGTLELVRSLGVDVVSSADLIQHFEARWTAAQLEMHLEAGRRVDRILAAAFDRIRERVRSGAGTNEFEMQQFIRQQFEASGMVTDSGPNVSVNANAGNPHYEPTESVHSPIKPGDFVLIDLWAKLNQPGSVFYDITWVGVCGQPTDEMQNVFNIVSGARDAAVSFVQSSLEAGRRIHGFEVDDVARGHITERGYGERFIHRTGHSIGEDVHGAGANMDNLETHDERLVADGTCFSVEPGIYLPHFGVRCEVNVYAGGGTARVTGEVQRELVQLG
jgi:Xaa-Pro aminopeptidase